VSIETELLTLASEDTDDERASVMHRAAIWIIAAKGCFCEPEPEPESEPGRMNETVKALQQTGWNRTQAAAKLGVSRTTIHKRLRKLTGAG
jgi:transcriptional regulator of acetoin/glycerol metabolism